ncbi:hypothetical protein METSCH_E04440 [Metschnikowia aff. pulcherrima]|uniref:SUN domain-containing protein n=1 Tax=Metschnikowia aff. pulcherrima TaxID=2163413 RepID=A0A4P6XRL7_9ASCO|nr:hypothetical protein METSCH_E04440 [Metschnikowia aff. pulcherrima]
MTGFPTLPLMRGDTDDDASIHLYSHVGPAHPISRTKHDRLIMRILGKVLSQAYKTNEVSQVKELNAKFEEYVRKSSSMSDREADDPHLALESTPYSGDEKVIAKNETGPLLRASFSRGRMIIQLGSRLYGFLLGVAIIFIVQGVIKHGPQAPVDLSIVSSRLLGVENNVEALRDLSVALDAQVGTFHEKQTNLAESTNHRLSQMEDSFGERLRSFVQVQQRYESLENEIDDLKKTINGLDILHDSPADLENRLVRITNEISRLSEVDANLQNSKNEIVTEVLKELPAHVPVYIKNNEIHYIPEFRKFLRSFVEKYGSRSNQDWEAFMNDSRRDFESYVQNSVNAHEVKFMTKEQFDRVLNERMSQLSNALSSKRSSLLEILDSGSYTSISNTGHETGYETVVDEVLERVGFDSFKVNHAEYNLGARILGFLTDTGIHENATKSLARTVFLGWYDYMWSKRASASEIPGRNANNILFDSGSYWQCGSSLCSVGVRLSSPIILTRIVLNNPFSLRPKSLQFPITVSIYVKPTKNTLAKALHDYTIVSSSDSHINSNRYLAKFLKVQEANLTWEQAEQHIRLPLKFVSQKVFVRDVFLKIHSNRGPTGLYNMKAYGLTKSDVKSYGQELDLLFSRLADECRISDPTFTDPAPNEIYTLEDDDSI